MSIFTSFEFYMLFGVCCFSYYGWQFKKLCDYIPQAHPQEWQKLKRNTLGKPTKRRVAINIKASVDSGVLSSVEDSYIQRFKRMEALALALFCTITAIRMTVNLYLSFSA